MNLAEMASESGEVRLGGRRGAASLRPAQFTHSRHEVVPKLLVTAADDVKLYVERCS